MGKARSASRHLDPYRVELAKRTALAKHELAMQMVAERVKTDAEFASAVLKLAGEGLREEIKKDALETIERVEKEKNPAADIALDDPPPLEPFQTR